MRILGIDPGMAIVGYSVVDIEGDKCKVFASGSIQTHKSKTDSQRLAEIYSDIKELIDMYKPDCASVEKLFFFRNTTTIIPVGQARGVILLALEQENVPVYEYTPTAIKQTITGNGRANKSEVRQMVCHLVENDEIPKLDDTADAIAIAVCHNRHCELIALQG